MTSEEEDSPEAESPLGGLPPPVALPLSLAAPRGLLGGFEAPGEQPAAPMPNDPQWALYLETVDFIAHNVERDPETALLLCDELKLRLKIDQQGAMLENEVKH